MKDFAAIDFETANRYPGSVCSVGVVIVHERQIAGRLYSLIRPRPDFYDYWNTRIHGLSAADTDEASGFDEVWRGIAPAIEGLTLVAHNSPFDEGCLRAVHELYGMPWPDYRFRCTVCASRRAFPRLPNHRLDTVAAHVGYELTDHHNALADAEACARIALRVF